MAFVPQSLLEQRKETAEQHARKQRMAAILRRIKQLYAPLRPPSLRRV
jgi:transcription elongation GreA/GreB family factor